MREARDLGTEYYGCEHLLLALLRNPAEETARVLSRHGIGFADVRTEILGVIRRSPEAPSVTPAG